MISPLEQTFIEEAAKVIHEWNSERVPVPSQWKGRQDTWRYICRTSPISQSERDASAMLCGALKAENRCSLEEIVKAASDAGGLDLGAIGSYIQPKFFGAIAREHLGLGKVFDEFTEFELEQRWVVADVNVLTPEGPAVVQRPQFTRLFSVPRLTAEGATNAER